MITMEQFRKKILMVEIIGFLLLIAMLWIDEIADFPHFLFGVPATPVNLAESAIESFFVVVLASFVIVTTRQMLHRIRYLEGILPICSFCRKIRVESQWVGFETYVSDHSEADFSHTVCPDCYRIHYPDL